MPTYDYQCEDCSYAFEKFQSITAKPIQTCPECKGRVKRLIGTGAGVIFKGSGFYETDYKRKRSNGTTAGTQRSTADSSKSDGAADNKTTSSKDDK